MFLFHHFNPGKPSQGRFTDLVLLLSERTLDYLFSPWATYCKIFHTHKPMGLLSGRLSNLNLRYLKQFIFFE